MICRIKGGFTEHPTKIFTHKVNSAVQKPTRQKLSHFCRYVAIAKLFCQKIHPNWSVLIGTFHPQNRNFDRKVRDFGNLGSPASHLKKPNVFLWFWKKERRGEISEIEPAQTTGLVWRGPLLRTPVRVWVAKAVKMQSRLAWNNLFANFSTLS